MPSDAPVPKSDDLMANLGASLVDCPACIAERGKPCTSSGQYHEERIAAAFPKSKCPRCDSHGVIADHASGLTQACPDCGGRRLTNDQVRQAHAFSTTRVEGEACGRLLVGRGDDTSDPLCVLPSGHAGRCLAEHEVNHGQV